MGIKISTTEVIAVKSYDNDFTAVVLENGAEIYVSVRSNEISIEGDMLDIE